MASINARLRQSDRAAQASNIAREAGAAFVRQALFAREFLRRRGESFDIVVGEPVMSSRLNSYDESFPYSSAHRKAVAETLRVMADQLGQSLPGNEENALRIRQLFPLN